MKLNSLLNLCLFYLCCSTVVFAAEQSSGFNLAPAPISVEQANSIDDKPFRYAYDPSITEASQEKWYDLMIKNGMSEDLAIQNTDLLSPEALQSIVDEWFPDTNFKSNNIVDVESMFVVSNMIVAKQLDSTPASGNIALRNQNKFYFSENKRFDNVSDREKQEQSEWLMVQTIELIGNYSNLKKNGNNIDPLIERAKNTLKQFGVKYSAMTIGEAGLEMEPWVESHMQELIKAAGEDFDADQLVNDLLKEIDSRE